MYHAVICLHPAHTQACYLSCALSCSYFETVKQINELEPAMERLTDIQLKAKTAEFKHQLDQGATLDGLLIEAFAVVREVSKRVLRLRHFDAQMVQWLRCPSSVFRPLSAQHFKHSLMSLMSNADALSCRLPRSDISVVHEQVKLPDYAGCLTAQPSVDYQARGPNCHLPKAMQADLLSLSSCQTSATATSCIAILKAAF